VSGSDFLPAFCQAVAGEGCRIFFLGAAPGVADAAKRSLERKHPGLSIVGTYSPPVGFERDEHECARVATLVRRAEPDVLFAAFGSPKQEKWLHQFRDQLNVPVSMGIGSTLDYLAGRLRRAPIWMQRAGLEWSYRLVQEPRRLWRRYLVQDPPFVLHILREWFQNRLAQ
jgi:N-acetylglucosaminyldiphosphoundecaprenol N-acetyl-beta-D-mannosaminyltransferase